MAADLSNLILPKIGAFRIWHERELFSTTKTTVDGPWCMPNVGDLIVTLDTGFQTVIDVDATTGLYLSLIHI